MNLFLFNLQNYIIELIPSLLIGFLLSGILHEFIPQTFIERYLTKKNMLTLICIAILGILLPLCCIAVLPVAVGLRKKGVSVGNILCFLVATPATSISAIIVTYVLFSPFFTLYLCFSVILIGLIIGVIGNLIPIRKEEEKVSTSSCSFCIDNHHLSHRHHKKGLKNHIISILSFAFIDLPKEIGVELIIGVFLATVVASLSIVKTFIKKYLISGFDYLFALIFGVSMYICATASVPLVHAFYTQGLCIGASLTLLLIGPITSYPTLLVIRKEFGNKVLLIYLLTVCIFSVLLGYLLGSI